MIAVAGIFRCSRSHLALLFFLKGLFFYLFLRFFKFFLADLRALAWPSQSPFLESSYVRDRIWLCSSSRRASSFFCFFNDFLVCLFFVVVFSEDEELVSPSFQESVTAPLNSHKRASALSATSSSSTESAFIT